MRVRNWRRWQTYRNDRGQPPWIKVHREVLRNVEWVSLSDAQRGQLVSMWILAADRDGDLPNDAGIIKKLCYMDEEPDLQLFISKGFLAPSAERRQDDDKPTPDRRQDDDDMTRQTRSREAEAEAEAEEETDTESEPGKSEPVTGVIERLLAHHNDELRKYREATGGKYRPHTWAPKIRKKVRVELEERGEAGEEDFRDAICGLFRSKWHQDRNNLTIQSVLNGTKLDQLADEYRSGNPSEKPKPPTSSYDGGIQDPNWLDSAEEWLAGKTPPIQEPS